jgi:hypothetical protein
MSVSCEHRVLSGRGMRLAHHTQRSPTECGVSECDIKTSTMKRPRPTRVVMPYKNGINTDDKVTLSQVEQ